MQCNLALAMPGRTATPGQEIRPVLGPSARAHAEFPGEAGKSQRSHGEYDESEQRRSAGVQPAEARRDY